MRKAENKDTNAHRKRMSKSRREREKESKADKMKGGIKSSNEKGRVKTQIRDNQA